MRIKVLKKLQSISEEKYKNFSLKLLPENTKLLGVRVPLIKKMAKQIKKNNESHTYLCIPLKQLEYQEEKMLFSLLIAYQDIAEEVIRMYGYDHVKSTFMPTAKVTTGGLNLRQSTELKLKRALCKAGAYECMHYSFFSIS